jgi:NitT/TauT family transport system substrate-binding protein
MAIMSGDDKAARDARAAMASASGTDLAGFDAQLATTKMFYTPADAMAFTQGAGLPKTMAFVANFLFDHGILGEGAPSAEHVGIAFPDGSIYGDRNNVKLRFDTNYTTLAAAGGL